jgi:hypothetical protein
MFTLAVFNNSIEFEPDTAGKIQLFIVQPRSFCAMFFGLSFLTATVAALWVRLSTSLAHN